MSDFQTMSAESQAALRQALAGAVTRSGVFTVKVHCASCGVAVETTRAALAAGEPPVWQTKGDGITTFCADHRPTCPGCGGFPDRLDYVRAWTGLDGGEITGRMCRDCSSMLRRRIELAQEALFDAADAEGIEPSSDEVPTFDVTPEDAWRVRDPIVRLLTR